jgi:RHS repeat-associated protein
VTTEYDALDRPTRTIYPDGTYDETMYERLDAVKRRDRAGRWSTTLYDALRRPVLMKDAAGRTITQDWRGCASGCGGGGGGKLTRLVDANGNETRWEYDIQGRLAKEIRANGAEYAYQYELSTSRLQAVTDPNGNVKTYGYNVDNTLAGITYAPGPGVAVTPNVSFTYDPAYNRVATMTDGTGTTTYGYHPVTVPPALGAGRLQSVDGPLTDDTITYQYDPLGRVASRQIGSAANTQTQAFDELGRLTTLTNPLGAFAYTYEGLSGRPASLTYPNGMQVTWSYYGNEGDHRLQQIHNKRPDGTTLSKFDYTYDPAGNISTWRQQADSDPAKVYEFGYDKTDQLTAAILKSTDPTPAVLKRQFWSYDPAGNRTAEQNDDAVTGAAYNNMNQLLSQASGGALVFKGTVNEPANVTIGGKPASVSADNRFEGQAVVPSGTGQVQVTATDPSGNVRTNTYEVSQGATSKSYTHDANGNMTSDGTRTYEWDAENRLVAVKQGGTTVATYAYNNDGIRTSKTVAGVTTAYILDGNSVVEEREGPMTTRRHHQGPGIDDVLSTQDAAGVATYLTRDHLGSVREHVTAGGTVTLRRSYDPWGSPVAGVSASGWDFTGRESEPEIGLHYYRARYYDPKVGRFISEDPIGLKGGVNFYGYVNGNPTNLVDPLGLIGNPMTAGYGALPSGSGASAATCQPSPCVSECLQKVFGTLPPITVYPNANGIPQWNGYISTGYRTIQLPGSCNQLFGDPELILEEYYHVLQQWERGPKRFFARYLYEGARAGGDHDSIPAEQEAMGFATRLLPAFADCLRKCKCK